MANPLVTSTLRSNAAHPGVRVGLAIVGTAAVLLTAMVVIRPDMMGIPMVRDLFVGFGL